MARLEDFWGKTAYDKLDREQLLWASQAIKDTLTTLRDVADVLEERAYGGPSLADTYEDVKRVVQALRMKDSKTLAGHVRSLERVARS